MSKTAQRKRQAYQEGLRHGVWGSGLAYSRHPFMDEYRKGYADGRARSKYQSPKNRQPLSMCGRLVVWIRRRFA